MTCRRLADVSPVLLLLFLCQGCASFGSYQSAKTLSPGRIVAVAHPNLELYNAPSSDGSGTTLKVLPSTDLGIRWGIRSHLDAGVRLGGTGLAGDAKYELLRDDTRTLSASIGGKVQRLKDADGNGQSLFELSAPVLIGFDLDENLELVVVPRIALQMVWYEIDASTFTFTSVFFPGLSIGAGWKVWENRLRLHPEVSVGYAVDLPHAIEGTPIVAGYPGFQLNVGLGVTFDAGWNNWYRGDGDNLPF